MPSTTVSKVVKSCQDCPPWASGITPAFFSASAAVKNSSQLVGGLTPAFFITSGLIQSQLTRCTLTGTAM